MNYLGRLKRKLQEGQKTTGAWLFTPSTDMAEVIGGCNFDAIMIDQEHGPGVPGEAVAQHRAIRFAGDSSTLIRIPWNDPVMVKKALDAGMEGIMFPCVNTAEEARKAVDACYFPPRGSRGAGLSATHATRYGRMNEEYLQKFEDNLLIICQIETAQAVENIEEIAAVDGVDMLFIGPYDLSGSIGKLGQFEDPEVKALYDRAVQKIKASGKWLGTISSGVEQSKRYFAQGHDFLLCASETSLVSTAADQLLSELTT
ncbi:HpcH/HpaI aldolase family protein [Sneathiella glossodoripedis]|uniref:HpcH/HpaI aldolase family protein n=1 Tax=Sneathiella glossodoripedis TaxID=418853 RepID=UPI000471E182|nr:aldolase/citrate lyase family protein [Sneathiella glossodoripedis]